MEPIQRRQVHESDRMAVQESVIAAVEANPEAFLAAYRALPGTFGGRYVCSDAFKETFAEYRASRSHRDRYNTPVHNAAAVLAAEQYDRALRDRSVPDRDTAIFLTGIPGAGKTSSLILTGFPAHCRVLFEGQLNRPETSFGKIERAFEEGLQIDIVAVHLPPELALARTLQRFTEHGRGASLTAMAEIQGGLSDGLRRLHARYGNDIGLTVVDNTPGQQSRTEGWHSLSLLEKEGNRDRIAQRLEQALEQHRVLGLPDDAYRHALGRSPGPFHAAVDHAGGGGLQGDDRERRPPTQDQQAADLKRVVQEPFSQPRHVAARFVGDGALRPARAIAFEQLSQDEAVRRHPELRGAYAQLEQARISIEQQHPLAEHSRLLSEVRTRVQGKLDAGHVLPPPARDRHAETKTRSPDR